MTNLRGDEIRFGRKSKRFSGDTGAKLRAAKNSRSAPSKAIRKAFDVALDAHKDIRRKSGEPYIYHPIAVAWVVAEEMGLGTTSIVCALLHDTVEDTYMTLDDVERLFVPRSVIVDGLTKMSGVFEPGTSAWAENFRKMLLTLSDDVRVILIKLADRLDNMRTPICAPTSSRKSPRDAVHVRAAGPPFGFTTSKQNSRTSASNTRSPRITARLARVCGRRRPFACDSSTRSRCPSDRV